MTESRSLKDNFYVVNQPKPWTAERIRTGES